MKAGLGFALWLAIWLGFAAHAANASPAERRVALVIGNANYTHAGVLTNTVNDAHAIAGLLKDAGFDSVDEKINVGVVEMKRAVRDFAAAARNADIALVYYSGHGIEANGVNYLIPVDARLAGAFDVDDEAVALDRLMAATQSAARLSLIILDACRENPFVAPEAGQQVTRSVSSHLIGVQPTGADSLIAYAAKSGSVSYDGAGPNSPFTSALLKFIAQPGLDIRIALGKVRDDVLASTGGRQEPYVYGSLGGGEVSLVPADPSAATESNGPQAAADDYAMAERVGTLEAWRAFVAVHTSGFYADLARAQLSKLSAPEPITMASRKPEAGSPQPPPAAAKPPQVAASPVPNPKPTLEAAIAASPDDACKREAERLAELRRDPTPEAVAEFARKMSCDGLRAQVVRLEESLGLPPIAAATQSPTPAAQPTSEASLSPCARDGDTLERLRIEQNPDAVAEFGRRLACPELRPQLDRLMESLGVKAPAALATQTRGVDPAPASAADKAATCAKETADLNRLRADPQHDPVKRFAAALRCDALKPQVARLLESLGD